MISDRIFCRRLILGTLLSMGILASSSSAIAAPHAARLWFYGNITAQISPHFSLTLMPGLRIEAARSGDKDALGHYMDEVFVGSNYHQRLGPVSMTLSLWYYFAGFDVLKDYAATHNLEFIPTFSLRLGRLSLASRTIFHNTFYSGAYTETSDRHGYGLVVRQLIKVGFSLSRALNIFVASEPFFGVIEDADAKPLLLGFWSRGFHMHRLYAGVALRLASGLVLVPQAIYETRVDETGAIDQHGYYLFMTLAYHLVLFDR